MLFESDDDDDDDEDAVVSDGSLLIISTSYVPTFRISPIANVGTLPLSLFFATVAPSEPFKRRVLSNTSVDFARGRCEE